jgi:hypothetical protein
MGGKRLATKSYLYRTIQIQQREPPNETQRQSRSHHTSAIPGLQEAYDFFNAELFSGSLPHVLVTLQRHAKAQGYFSPDRFTARTEKAAAHELAMNPDSFTGRTDEEILSTLAHCRVSLLIGLGLLVLKELPCMGTPEILLYWVHFCRN